MSSLTIGGEKVCAGPVVAAPTLPECLQQFRILATCGDNVLEGLRRTMREMCVQVVAVPEDTRFVARCADRAERKDQQSPNCPTKSASRIAADNP